MSIIPFAIMELFFHALGIKLHILLLVAHLILMQTYNADRNIILLSQGNKPSLKATKYIH